MMALLNRSTKLTIILSACSVLFAISGVLHGIMDYRWGTIEQMQLGARQIEDVPLTFGNWEAKTNERLDAATVNMLRCTGDLFRIYRHRISGHEVSIVLMVGPTGPLVQHTPDVCYRSSNFQANQERQGMEIVDDSGVAHAFYLSTFQENTAAGRLLRVYYSLHDGRLWQAPSHPRTHFSGVPMVYKIQVASYVDPSIEGDGAIEFLRDILPQLEARIHNQGQNLEN